MGKLEDMEQRIAQLEAEVFNENEDEEQPFEEGFCKTCLAPIADAVHCEKPECPHRQAVTTTQLQMPRGSI